MFLHRLRNRGVAMICYAVLLAFITGIGGLFMSDKSLSGAIEDVIKKDTNIIKDAGGKHALKGTGILPEVLRALDFQTKIPYDYISAKLADGQQLEAIEYDTGGSLKHIWYSENGILKSMSNSDVSKYSGTWTNNNDSVQGEYYKTWQITYKGEAFTNYNASSGYSGMFTAYDKYGNVIQSVDTSKFSSGVINDVKDKNTNIGLNKSGTKVLYLFNNNDGFYEAPKKT